MNTERLYSIAHSVLEDLSESGALNKLSALNKAIRNQMNSPSSENTTAFEEHLSELEILQNSQWFDYPETWNSALEHIGATSLKNARFVKQASSAVRGNSITLETAANSISEIHTRLSELNTSLEKIISAFKSLGLESYELPEESAELSVLLPREAFGNTVAKFAKDAGYIARFFELAEEISTGERTPARLEELSTTDPLIIAGVSIPACLFVLKVVKEVVETIKSTYELREARARAITAEASTKTLKSIDDDIQGKIEDGLKEIVNELLKEHKSTVRGRTSELRNELALAIPQIAARIDNGYRIEGNAHGKNSPEEEDSEQEETVSEVNNISHEISYERLPNSPMLQINIEVRSDQEQSSD